MESASAKVRYSTLGRIDSIETVVQKQWVEGVGKEASFKDVADGYKIKVTSGSQSIVLLFQERPELALGPIKLTIENV
jgi:hypothetical protein